MTTIRHAATGTLLRWTARVLVGLASMMDRPPQSRVQYIQEGRE